MKNSKSRFGDYITVVYALNNTFLIIVLYRHVIKCVIKRKVKYIEELKYRVLAPWGPSSISAVAELISSEGCKGCINNINIISSIFNNKIDKTSSATAEIDDGPHGASTLYLS